MITNTSNIWPTVFQGLYMISSNLKHPLLGFLTSYFAWKSVCSGTSSAATIKTAQTTGDEAAVSVIGTLASKPDVTARGICRSWAIIWNLKNQEQSRLQIEVVI